MAKWWWMAAVSALALATPAMADEGETWTSGGKGAATALVNVLYIPAKLVYATTGGIVGGLAYAVTAGDREVAQTVWEPSVGGSYVMTTDQLFPPAYGESKLESETSLEGEASLKAETPSDRLAGSESQWPE
jgi:hypothetical protein